MNTMTQGRAYIYCLVGVIHVKNSREYEYSMQNRRKRKKNNCTTYVKRLEWIENKVVFKY